MKNLKKIILLLTVFITGACILIIEVVAVRVLSPYYGNTIFTYSSVITVILAALSVGYYFGGKLADKKPDLKLFYGIILIGGLTILFLQLMILFILPIINIYFSIINGPLISSIILFFIPSFLLGTLSPFAIKLLEKNLPQEGIGSISGKVFFWSTAGSIVGSLLAGFLLIPNFGINKIIISVGLILVVLGLIGLTGAKADKKIIFTMILLILSVSFFNLVLSFLSVNTNVIYQSDGVYEKITILDGKYNGKPTRFLFQDRTYSGAIHLDSEEHAFEYSKYYVLYKIFKPDVKDILVIGGGAYTVPKIYYNEITEAKIDVVEIEPSLFELAKKYFDVPDNPRLENHLTDGRRFLKDSTKKYDVIFVDAFHSLYSIPIHLTSKEFFELAKSKLKAGGIFIGNFIGDLQQRPRSFIYSEIKTFNSVFDNSYFFATRSPKQKLAQNIMFVGYNSDQVINFKNLNLKEYDSDFITTLPEKLIDVSNIDFSIHPVFTDNYSPVEYFIAETLRYGLNKS
jgi:spermidine synthase